MLNKEMTKFYFVSLDFVHPCSVQPIGYLDCHYLTRLSGVVLSSPLRPFPLCVLEGTPRGFRGRWALCFRRSRGGATRLAGGTYV